MTERINKALTEVEEELESALNIIIYSANQIKKDMAEGNPILELIKSINSKSSIIVTLNDVAKSLRQIENGDDEIIEKDG